MAETEAPKKPKADKKAKKGDKAAAFEVVDKQKKGVTPRLSVRYQKEIVPALMKEFGYANPMQVPRLQKIVLNMGLGEATSNPNLVNTAADELTQLTGQRAVITRSKKAISNFKLRGGQAIGCMVTLRRERMWEFLDRLVAVALPRVRDFKGINGKAFDGRGNYTLGLREQTIFPEINYDRVEKVKGMNITFATTAGNDEQGKALLKHLGLPFRN